MKCLKCGGSKLRVLDKRQSLDRIRRRRACLVCNHRFSTIEVHIDDGELRKHKHERVGKILFESSLARVRKVMKELAGEVLSI